MADITSPDKSYGISILNDCKYGWDKPNDNTLRLTLLHAPSTKDRYKYQEQQDFGHHTFTYSIVGHQNEALPGRNQSFGRVSEQSLGCIQHPQT